MEENTVEIFEYFRVIWKRKILIIVVTLVCMGIGVMNLKLKPKPKLQVAYRAEATVKIGKKMQLESTSSISPRVDYIEDPVMLSRILPIKYDFKFTETLGYHFDIEQVDALAMIKLTLIGPDREVERALKEIVDILIDEHHKKAKNSVIAYKDFMKILGADAEMLKKEMLVINESIKEIRKKEGEYEMLVINESIKEIRKREGEYLVGIESNETVRSGDKIGGDRSAFLNMLYLKTIDKERDLHNCRAELRQIQTRLTMQQITLGNLEECKTELVGMVMSSAIEPKGAKTSTKNRIVLAGVTGLIMSLLISFFMEYLEESKSRLKRKGNGKVDAA